MTEPEEILTTDHLLQYGPSYAGYQGELQFRYALNLEYQRRVELERQVADLKSKLSLKFNYGMP